ncbi:hypothetical protein JCM10212_006035 [Sporobolomyces blumeae]
MNFLSSLSNAVLSASSAALAATSPIPGVQGYSLGERVSKYDGKSIWTLYHGTRKEDQSPVSIFSFDTSSASSSHYSSSSVADRRAQFPLAKNAFRKLRALRHPNILKFLDGSESDSAVWIITEPVRPLVLELESASRGTASTPSSSASEESKIYGLLHVVTALTFLNRDGSSVHGGLRTESVWITPGGEWKLGGFEVCSRVDEQDAAMWNFGGLLPDSKYHASPEVRKGGWTALKEYDASVYDSYLLHLFLYQLFNGPLPNSFLSPSPSETPSLPQTHGNLPQTMFQPWRRLGNPNPLARLKTAAFFELGGGNAASASSTSSDGWWSNNRLVRLSNALEGFALASENERATLVRTLKAISSRQASSTPSLSNAGGPSSNGLGNDAPLPSGFLTYKILPSLLHTFEFGGPSSPQLLPLILSLSSPLSSTEYSSKVLSPVLRMFATPDRAMRMALLEGLETFGDKLTQKDVNEKVWPHLLTGFGDVVPVIREATVKSILLIAPKLSDRILNNDLLRYLSKTQTDVEPGIRTNTCILLSRLSKHLSPSTQRKVLIPAFARALRDPFVHARIAGLMALMATVEAFEKEDLAGKVIPAMSICLVDKEKAVRDQGYKAIDMFVKKCEALTASMPETAIPLDANSSTTSNLNAPSASSQPVPAPPVGLATNAAGAAGALAGWAFGSVSKKLSSAELAAPIERRDSTPTLPVPGQATTPSGSTPQSLPGGFAFEAQTENGGAKEDWGGDLMDVNDDAEDWNEFETGQAPPPSARIDPLAARLSASRTKPSPLSANGANGKRGAMRLGAASKSSALRVPMDMDATDSWDLDFDEKQASPAASARGVKPKPAPPLSAAIPRSAAPPARSTPIAQASALSRPTPPTTAPAPTPAPAPFSASRTASPAPVPRVSSPSVASPLPTIATPPPAPVPPATSTVPPPPITSPPPISSLPPNPSSASRPQTPISAAVSTVASPALSNASSVPTSSQPPPSSAGGAALTKEEKAAKMAQAREERRKRMAAAKAAAGNGL